MRLPDGRVLHAYDTGGDGSPVVVWHHGTPNIGTPPEPLFAAANRLGVRWLSYDRPAYGGSSPEPGRDVASAAELTAAIADAVGVDRFALMGHSGGSPHALACAALLPERTSAVLAVSTLAPYAAEGLDWFAGMAPQAEATLRAAAAGREAKERHEATATDDGSSFTGADHAALAGEWGWFGSVVAPALKDGPGGLIDDDLAYVAPVGLRPGADPGAGAPAAWRPGPDRADRPRGVAGRSHPRSRTAGAARRRAYLGARCGRLGARVARRSEPLTRA